MISRIGLVAGVIVVFGPQFTPTNLSLIPGKECTLFLSYKPRRPLALEETLCSEDGSNSGLNYRVVASLEVLKTLTLCTEAPCSPRALLGLKDSSWTSGHMSSHQQPHATANSQLSSPPSIWVAHVEKSQAFPSLWKARRYGSLTRAQLPLLLILHNLFPALARALLSAPWSSLSSYERIEVAANAHNLTHADPNVDGNMSSDDDGDESDNGNESDDAITSYDGSAPSSPIQNPSPSPADTHPDNSQFSTLAQVSTPNIIRQAQSAVFSAPSSIRDARLSSAPYSTPVIRSGPNTPARTSSNPATRPPSRGLPLPTMASAFGLPPSMATPIQINPPHLVAPTSVAANTLPSTVPEMPFVERITVSPPAITPTLPGLIPEEWAQFKKSVIEYNLTLDLYKPDLDWKKEHLNEPREQATLAEYHLCIGRVNQRVGAIALMEKVLGNYISTVGIDLVQQQAKEDNLNLPQGDIEWFLMQGKKDNSRLLQDERVPQEDLAPALFLPPLPTTPAPEASRILAMTTPVSSLTPLPASVSAHSTSLQISELATPVIRAFPPPVDTQQTPKALMMDISPPHTSPVPMLLAATPSASTASIIQPISTDVLRRMIKEPELRKSFLNIADKKNRLYKRYMPQDNEIERQK